MGNKQPLKLTKNPQKNFFVIIFMLNKIKNLFYILWPFAGLLIIGFAVWSFFKPVFNHERGLTEDSFQAAYVPEYNIFSNQDALNPAKPEDLNFDGNFDLEKEISQKKGKIVNAGSVGDLLEYSTSLNDGDAIILKNGEYKINLTIDKAISIIGESKNAVLISGKDDKAVLEVSGRVELKNLTIKDSKIGIEAVDADINIADVYFDNIGATAFYAKNSMVRISDNKVINSSSALKFINSKGEIADSMIENNKKSGIHLINSKFSIKNNKITGNQSYGIYADAASEIDLSGNYIEENKGYNVRIEGEKTIYK